MRTYLLPAWFAGVMLAPTPGVTGEPSLDELKQTYAAEMQKINEEHNGALRQLLDTYGQTLSRVVELLKQQGDPQPVVVGIAELIRFERDQTVPSPPADDLPKPIQEVQSAFLSAAQRADVERARKSGDMTRRYAAALDRLMRKYTGENKMDLALAAKAAKEHTESLAAGFENQSRAAAAPAPLPAPKSIPEDAAAWNKHHYKFFAQSRVHWDEARRKCSDLGGHLATLETQEELAFVYRLKQGCAWTSGSLVSNVWVWPDGSPVTVAAPAPPDISDAALLIPLDQGALLGRPKNGFGPHAKIKWVDGYICEWDD